MTEDIIEHQKGKAIDKVEEKKGELEDKLKGQIEKGLGNLVPGRKDKDSTQTDSTKTEKEKAKEEIEDKVKDGLKNLFNKGKKKD